MDFESLKLFLAVAEHASFTRAAIELGMTQPTISKRIQQLETQLGSLLLYRHGRGVRLTEAGVRLAEVARSVLLQLASTITYYRPSRRSCSARRVRSASTGSVRIGLTWAVFAPRG